jgi:capsular polysaccharide biosynthesis protein
MAERPPSADPPPAVEPTDAPPIDLRRSLAAFRRSGLIIVALVVAVTVVAYQAASHADPRYRATARLIQDPTAAADSADPVAVDRELTTARSLATSTTVLDEAARGLPDVSADDLAGHVSARILTPDEVLSISATAGDAATAARMANTVAAALIAERARVKTATAVRTREALDRALRRARREHSARSVLEALRARLSAAVADEATTGEDLRLVGPAATPAGPYAPKPRRNAALAALAALLIGLLVALARDRLHPRTEDGEDMSRVLGLPLLAVFPIPTRRVAAGHVGERAGAHLAHAARVVTVRVARITRRVAGATATALERARPAPPPSAKAARKPKAKPGAKAPAAPATAGADAAARARAAAVAVAAALARVARAVEATSARIAESVGRADARAGRGLPSRVGRPSAGRQIFGSHARDALVSAVRRSLPATRRRQRVLVVCGIARRSRAAVVARSLAEGLAESGLATLLVLTDGASARAARQDPSAEPPDALDVERITRRGGLDTGLARLVRCQYDYVVIAGPALTRSDDIRAVARHVRAAIVVGRGDRTTVAAAAHARRVLDALGLHGLGAVATTRRPGAQPRDGLAAVPAPGTNGRHADEAAPAGALSLARAAGNGSGARAERPATAAHND